MDTCLAITSNCCIRYMALRLSRIMTNRHEFGMVESSNYLIVMLSKSRLWKVGIALTTYAECQASPEANPN